MSIGNGAKSKMAMKTTILAIGMLMAMQISGAQQQAVVATPRPAPAPGVIASHPDWPKANPEDVKSPEAIIQALSDTISGEASKARDWNRFKSLFVPGAGRMMIVRHSKTGPADLTILSTDDYQARAGNQTFYEKPIAYEKQSFGHMTHVYESYAIFHTPTDTTPQTRGVNSWELMNDGTRYWILQVYWDTERPDNPIPAALAK
ncbi:hypothetical protein [Terriglobus sp. ADX1]|uniref:hypothetical protein n=1 Tax=Terriglobus sp. ADX1 TaxID=2794063 RepID=UPI002FE5FA7A